MTDHRPVRDPDTSGSDEASIGDATSTPDIDQPENGDSLAESFREVVDEIAEGWDRMRDTIGPFSVADPDRPAT